MLTFATTYCGCSSVLCTAPHKCLSVIMHRFRRHKSSKPCLPQVVNQEMLDFGRNWVTHLRSAGASNFLVGVYEPATAAALAAAGGALPGHGRPHPAGPQWCFAL